MTPASSSTISIELLSLNGAAKALRVGAVTLRRWIAEGRLPEAFKDEETGAFYIPREGIERSIKAGWAKRTLTTVSGGVGWGDTSSPTDAGAQH